MAKSYQIHVVSNTHWDREWLYNFQETRLQLVHFFKTLLHTLDTVPEYKSFVLDSQTVPIEDYLEVHPEDRDRIANYVADGRLLIGPWYTCPESFNVTGESIVRNLLYGHRVARSFGKVMKIGHTPFSYGQNSQMPQIYLGFGIDTILYYHGITHDTELEFIFEGADGSQIMASQMSSYARYNFYHHVYRNIVYGEKMDDRMYSWTEGGLPFHRCNDDQVMGHHFLLDPVKHFYKDRIGDSVRWLREAEAQNVTTNHMGFMDGHDSSVADPIVLEIIEEAKKHLPDDTIFHSTLPDYIDSVKANVKNLKVLKGESRIPKMMGGRIHLYSDVMSSRTRMKRRNAQAEQLLQQVTEPFAVMAWALGDEYPKAVLDMAWKQLLRCHAHDSIAGSGVDDIEQDMHFRLRQVINIAQAQLTRSLGAIQTRIDNSDADPKDVLLTVFNPSPFPRTEVVSCAVDLPKEDAYKAISLVNATTGKKAVLQQRTVEGRHAVVNHAGNAPSMLKSDRFSLHFEAQDVPAMGYATYRVTKEATPVESNLVVGVNAMENEYLKVQINTDGTVAVTHKATNTTFDNLNYFEDGGEVGCAWMHVEPARDEIITSHGFPVSISLEESGPLVATYKIEWRMEVPTGMKENGGDPWKRLDGGDNAASRGDERKVLSIVSLVTLRKGARAVDVTTKFTNAATHHRLRAMFPTRLAAKKCHVESAFDVLERDTEYAPGHPWYHAKHPTFPMRRFVDVSDGKVGLAVLNDGLREYEVTQDNDKAIALTLMRAYEVSLTTVSYRWEERPDQELSQCQGDHTFRYRIYPHAGTWDKADVYREADRLTAPIETAQAGPHGGTLPRQMSFVEVQPANLIVSALKQAEDGHGIVVRLFNPSNAKLSGRVTFHSAVAAADRISLEEVVEDKMAADGNAVALEVGPKKIVTLKVKLK